MINPYEVKTIEAYKFKDLTNSASWQPTMTTQNFIQTLGYTYPQSKWYADREYYDELFTRLIDDWYDKDYYCFIDNDPDFTISEKDRLLAATKSVYRKMLTIAYNTHDKYIPAIKKYKEFLDSEPATVITSKSAVRVNDTPTQKGDYSADTYTSAITQSESTQSIDSVDRYQQVRHLLNNIYLQWMAEFKPLEKILI